MSGIDVKDAAVPTSPVPVLERLKEEEAAQALDAPEVESAGPQQADEDPPEEGAPAWMLTFGDMMSLLLTFFILLYSMSEVEVEQFRLASLSIREALGADDGEQLISDVGPAPGSIVPLAAPAAAPTPQPRTIETAPKELSEATEAALEEIRRQLEGFVAENRLQDMVAVTKESGGVFLRIRDMALFTPGSTQLEAASVAVIEQLGDMTKSFMAPVIVAGHTDNVPIRSPIFASNWELSAARAAGVARVLVDRGHQADRVTVEAYGQHRPLASNDTPEGRAQNRRVELHYSRQNIEAAILGEDGSG